MDWGWFIEFDIEECYNIIPRGRLMDILGEQIADQKILDISGCFTPESLGWFWVGGTGRRARGSVPPLAVQYP